MAAPKRYELEVLHKHICRAVGSPLRIHILYVLNDKPMNVNALAARLGLPQATTSRHLAVLRQSGVVETTREGPSVTYRLADIRIIAILDEMRALLRSVLARSASLVAAPKLPSRKALAHPRA